MFSAKTMLDRGGETDIKQASKNGIMKTAEPRFNSCKTVTAPKVDLFYSLKRGAEHAGIRRSRSPKASGDIVASPSLRLRPVWMRYWRGEPRPTIPEPEVPQKIVNRERMAEWDFPSKDDRDRRVSSMPQW